MIVYSHPDSMEATLHEKKCFVINYWGTRAKN